MHNRCIIFSTEMRYIIGYKNPGLECPREKYEFFSHSSTIAPTVLAAFLCHKLASSSLTQRLQCRLASFLSMVQRRRRSRRPVAVSDEGPRHTSSSWGSSQPLPESSNRFCPWVELSLAMSIVCWAGQGLVGRPGAVRGCLC